jgi:hypothetical protein
MDGIARHLLGKGAGVFAFALAAGTLALAQSPAPGTQPQPQNQPSAGPAASAPDSGATQPQRTIQMVQAQASLDHTLDAKKAQQGQAVTARLSDKVEIPNQQELPRNSVLEGHVDAVTPSEHKSDSQLVVTFDKVKLKDGQELPIKATVLAVAEPALAQQQQAAGGGSPSAGGPMPSPSPQAGGGGPNSGGAPPQASQPMNAPEPGSSSQQQSQKNGVPGVTLKSDIHDHTSATFMSKGRNVDVPSGTQMALAIAVLPPGVKLQ